MTQTWPIEQLVLPSACQNAVPCGHCQKSSTHVQRTSLVSLPVVSEPFSRIGTDIVGPLPRSRSGNCYILVICDYATRYPEAMSLRNIDAEHVAEEMFSRVGIPNDNYEVNMIDKQKQPEVFHVNMLRQWHSPVDLASLTTKVWIAVRTVTTT